MQFYPYTDSAIEKWFPRTLSVASLSIHPENPDVFCALLGSKLDIAYQL